MDVLLRSIDFTASGREIVREREISADTVTVGRASENEIALPDLAIEQRHLTITELPTGVLDIAIAGTLGFSHDGVASDHARIDPARGGEIRLGSYRLEIAREDSGRVVITQHRIDDDFGAAKDRLEGFGLEGTMLSRRAMSWVALLLILGAFLAVPIYTHMNRAQAEPDMDGEGTVLMDASWSTGALSSVHHGLENSCESCHVEPFVAVRDETCLTCHTGLGDHADGDRLVASFPEFTGGDALLWQVGHALNKPGPGACTDCHTEHEGAGRMEPTSERFCADCHGDLDARLTDTALGNASDFGRVHPQFQALVMPGRGGQETRVSLDGEIADFNGLKFPHDMHLSTTNGVARMALNLNGDTLECSSCHAPTADGVRFLPVDMETSCESCHSLVYDRVGTTFRRLSHGDIAQVEADLIAADRAPRRPVSSGRRRPGPYQEGGIYYGNFNRTYVPTIGNALADDGLCGECHYRDTSAPGRLAVLPVTQRNRYLLHGWFDHDAHGATAMGTRTEGEACATCHAADTSGEATDLLLPDLASCRDCHGGESTREADVPSGCAMCHSFHPRGATAAPPRIARRER